MPSISESDLIYPSTARISTSTIMMFGMAHRTSGRNGGFEAQQSGPNTFRAPDPHSKTGHDGVTCDNCKAVAFIGVRYRCSMCPDYDLCESCIERNESSGERRAAPFHDPTHIFYRLSKKSRLNQDACVDKFPVIINRSQCVHTGVACSYCEAENVVGYLYKCQQCLNINLCEACEVKGLHDPSHPRTKLGKPSAESMALAESHAEIARLKAELANMNHANAAK